MKQQQLDAVQTVVIVKEAGCYTSHEHNTQEE